MKNADKKSVPRMHPRRFDWIVAIPITFTFLVCLMSLGGLYQTWLEPFGLHEWMKNVFHRGFSGFALYTDNPARYYVIFSWIIVGSCAASVIVSLASIPTLYKYIVQSPRHYIGLTITYLFMLSFFLFFYHGPSNPDWDPTRGTRTVFYSGLFSFGFWGFVLAGSSFYTWCGVFAGLGLVTRRVFGLEDAPSG